MPSVKLPRKSTDTDMTPFVDVAFLILSFFMLATKFKPPEPVEITTPGSVNSQPLPESNAVMIIVDSSNRVFFSVLSDKDPAKLDAIIQGINTSRALGLSNAEMANYKKTFAVGVSFGNLKQLLSLPPEEQNKLNQPGIPVMDSANNELYYWLMEAQRAFQGQPLKYLIKGDAQSKYPTFEAVVSALKRNDQFKYNLVTALDDIPSNSELEKYNKKNLKEK